MNRDYTEVHVLWVCTSDQYGTEKIAGIYRDLSEALTVQKSLYGTQSYIQAIPLDHELVWRH